MVKWFSKEKPRKLQIVDSAESLFKFSLRMSGGKELDGRLVDLRMDGAAISFPLDACPDFEDRERVRLVLTALQTEKKTSVDALVRDSRADENARLCHFEFIDTSGFLQDLDPDVMSYFNRRRAFRVKTDPLEPITVNVTWENGSDEGWIVDISTTGIALGVSKTTAKKLEDRDRITLVFQLPETDGEIRIIGRTVRMQPKSSEVLYGIDFNRKESENMRRADRAISRFVAQRQLVMLKMQPEV